MKIFKFWAWFFTGLLLSGAVLMAQTAAGTVSGTVTDSTGGSVASATVELRNMQTQETRIAKTGAAGNYLFPSVPTGEYTLDAQAQGFKREQRAGIKLDVNQNARVDFHLQVGQVTEVVEVKGGAPLVDTRDVQLGGTVDEHRVQDLPLDGRNVYDLMALMPGVTNVSTNLTGTASQCHERNDAERSSRCSRERRSRYFEDRSSDNQL